MNMSRGNSNIIDNQPPCQFKISPHLVYEELPKCNIQEMLLWGRRCLVFSFLWTTLRPGNRDPPKDARTCHGPENVVFTFSISLNLNTTQQGQYFWLIRTLRFKTRGWHPHSPDIHHLIPTQFQVSSVMCMHTYMCVFLWVYVFAQKT